MIALKMKEWVNQLNDNDKIVWAYTGDDISFEEIGVIREQKPEQESLFGE